MTQSEFTFRIHFGDQVPKAERDLLIEEIRQHTDRAAPVTTRAVDPETVVVTLKVIGAGALALKEAISLAIVFRHWRKEMQQHDIPPDVRIERDEKDDDLDLEKDSDEDIDKWLR